MTTGNGQQSPDARTDVWKALEIVVVILVGLNVTMSAWLVKKDADFEHRVSVMEANRFTSEDGVAMWRAMAQKADRDDVPPQEVLRRLGAIEEAILRIETRMDGIERGR